MSLKHTERKTLRGGGKPPPPCGLGLRANTGWWKMMWKAIVTSDLNKYFGSKEIHSISYYHTFGIDSSKKMSLKNQSPPSSIWLYACIDLQRGDYIYSIAEIVGLGQSTVSTIVNEVSEGIVTFMWNEFVGIHMPKSDKDFKEKIALALICLCNSLAGSCTRSMWNDGDFLSWNHISKLFHDDLDCGLHLVPKLTNDHINLTSFSVMNVRLAAEVLSGSVYQALQTFGPSEAGATAKDC